ncbi:hypothetical protein ACTOB_005975 [Actinoplanes oblitus]|uniref:Reductase C-terminal domain-containing protein n=1 Tax=Actinoplanes oblitus TaxID=3040509 RepID=A0ABY8W9E1_9ACTN|nr:hypothetical protein [Actinoplanes oblitus]WIM93977.1 hypothetical protein ACTOB_005975 [Actinoplanes oblitus]
MTPIGADRRPEQSAAYRYPDGTVVFVGQTRGDTFGAVADTTGPELAELPFTAAQLARLATDESLRAGG